MKQPYQFIDKAVFVCNDFYYFCIAYGLLAQLV